MMSNRDQLQEECDTLQERLIQADAECERLTGKHATLDKEMALYELKMQAI